MATGKKVVKAKPKISSGSIKSGKESSTSIKASLHLSPSKQTVFVPSVAPLSARTSQKGLKRYQSNSEMKVTARENQNINVPKKKSLPMTRSAAELSKPKHKFQFRGKVPKVCVQRLRELAKL